MDSYISGRHTDYPSGQSQVAEVLHSSYHPVGEFGIHCQSGEMLQFFNSTDNIPGSCIEHHLHDYLSSGREDGTDSTKQSSDALSKAVFILRTVDTLGQDEPCSSDRHLDCSTPLPVSAERSCRGTLSVAIQIEEENTSVIRCPMEGPGMVDGPKTQSFQRTSNSSSAFRPNNQDRYFLERTRGNLQWPFNRRTMGLVEAGQHINDLEVKAVYLALQSFLRQMNQPPRHILLEMDNATAVAYVNKRGGTHSTTLSSQALQI